MEDKIYKYVGLGLIILVAIYILVKSLKMNTKIVEGLTNNKNNSTDKAMSELSDDLKKTNEKLKDTLLLDKYKTD